MYFTFSSFIHIFSSFKDQQTNLSLMPIFGCRKKNTKLCRPLIPQLNCRWGETQNLLRVKLSCFWVKREIAEASAVGV